MVVCCGGKGEDGKEKPGLIEKYARFCFKWPKAVFFSLVVFLFVLAILAFAGGSPLSTTEGNEWNIKDHTQTQRDQGLAEALDDFGESSGEQPPRSEEDFPLKFQLVYKADEDNLFTEENLRSIWEVEKTIWGHDNFTQYCELVYGSDEDEPPVCRRPVSILNVFYTYDGEKGSYSEEMRQSIEDGIKEIQDNPFENGFLVDKSFAAKSITKHTRSLYYFGLPLQNRDESDPDKSKNYTNSYTDEDDQREDVKDEFLGPVRDDLFDLLGMKAPFLRTKLLDTGKKGNVEVVFYSFALEDDEFLAVIQTDFALAFLSIFSVWVYMLIHLGSVFLASMGVFEVFMSFPVALFFYKLVFQIEYFDFLHLLVIFILLGIGADDVFVFTDAFKQSKAVRGVGTSLESRLIYTCKRASKAVFVTSFTTMAAFLASAASPLMPMQSFGIFAALCIVLLFLINVTMMPVILVLWAGYTPWCVKNVCCCIGNLHNRLNWSAKCPCCTCCHIDPDDTFNMPMGTPYMGGITPQVSGPPPATGKPAPQEMSAADVGDKKPTALEIDSRDVVNELNKFEEDVSQLRVVERFFNGRFFNFVEKARWVILVCGAALFVVGIVLVSGFEPPSETEKWWPENHAFTKFIDLTDKSGPFPASADDEVAEVHLVWGIKGMKKNYNVFDPDDFGTIEYDEEFDITSDEAQKHLLNVCKNVRQATCRPDADLCKRDDEGFLVLLDRSPGAKSLRKQAPCWIERFDDWLKTDEGGSGSGLPLAPEAFIGKLKEFVETPIVAVEFPQDIGFIGEGDNKELKFVQFIFDSTYEPPASYAKAQPILDSWDDFMNDMNNEAKNSGAEKVSGGYATGGFAWTWPPTQNSLVRSAVQGVILVFVLAFVVLNIATGNVVISSISVITVAGIVLTVLGVGIRGIMGWKLGIAESIVSTILIGFSMDYTLHLADSYMESQHNDRKSRTKDALTHLGISVTAGALTTLISGIFLWFAVLVFFTKFAFNITATILASYLWSVLFFPAVCLVVGPENDFGNWKVMIQALLGMCSKKG